MKDGDSFVIGTIPAGSKVLQTERGVEVEHPDGTLEIIEIEMHTSPPIVRRTTCKVSENFIISVGSAKS
jgi:hypothetical protein